MKTLLTTTALAVTLAMPVSAQTNDTTTTQSQTSDAQQTQEMDIMASDLIGHRLYIQSSESEAGASMQGGPDETADAQDGMTTEGDETAEADMDGGVEGEVEEAADAAEGAAEETGEAIEGAGQEIASEVDEVPEDWRGAGDIADALITREGEIGALIVDAGGFLGMGETQKLVEMDNVRLVPDSDDEGEFYAVFTGDRSMFEEQADYDEAMAQELGQARALDDPEVRAQAAERGYGPDATAQMEPVSWDDITTEELLGARVYGENDEWVGDLSELALADDGSVDGVIVDVGGFLGLFEKPVMLSQNDVEIRGLGGDLRAYVSATEEELENMPEWEGDR